MSNPTPEPWKRSRKDMQSYVVLAEHLDPIPVVYLYPPDDAQRIPILGDNCQRDADLIMGALQSAEHKALDRAANIASTWHNTGLTENVRAADKACEEVARAIRAEIGDGDAS